MDKRFKDCSQREIEKGIRLSAVLCGFFACLTVAILVSPAFSDSLEYSRDWTIIAFDSLAFGLLAWGIRYAWWKPSAEALVERKEINQRIVAICAFRFKRREAVRVISSE